jgi:F-type H+-transporting ATPase subunit b
MKDWRGTDPYSQRGSFWTKEKRAFIGRASACLAPYPVFLLMASCAFASGGAAGEEGPNWFDFIWRLFNFLALVGLLYWLLAKRIKEFLVSRREGIRTALAEAETARRMAHKKFQEYAEKLDKATGEIEQIGETIRAQGLAEKTRLIEDARKVAEKMKEDTQARMEQEFSRVSRQLRIEAVQLSVQMAEELLKKQVRLEDHETMVKDTIEKVVKNP